MFEVINMFLSSHGGAAMQPSLPPQHPDPDAALDLSRKKLCALSDSSLIVKMAV
jgi:hypothetical protein